MKRGSRCSRGRGRGGLRARIFVWFGVSIAASALVGAAVFHFFGGGASWRAEAERARQLASSQFARVWEQPERRDAFAQDMARDLDVGVVLRNPTQGVLGRYGPQCGSAMTRVPVRRGGREVGEVLVCLGKREHSPGALLAALAAAALVLWGLAGLLARRLTRPLYRVVDVARQLGEGKLEARVRLGHRATHEVRALGDTINDMADRIQKQLDDQRELLAAVSHEIRTPLTRLRVLVELGQEGTATPEALRSMEVEVREIDALIGQLLASSRLDFKALRTCEMDGVAAALEAVQRAGLDEDRLEPSAEALRFHGDPTLVARALANLMDNAVKHGGGVARVRVTAVGEAIRFAVEDRGRGFTGEGLRHAFDRFYGHGEERGDGKASLGLGLALVKRIAEAHGGTVGVENLEEGARVWFSVAAGRTDRPTDSVPRPSGSS